jgi:hypothetical protein
VRRGIINRAASGAADGLPEASPTLPLAASLGLTFSYNVTIGIPTYLMIAQKVTEWLPLGPAA